MAKYQSIKNWSEDEQPREKLMKYGAEVLSNSELIGILLGSGTREKSAIEVAKELLQLADNNLEKLAKMCLEEYCKINGIGPAKAVTLLASVELSKRYDASHTKDTVSITSPQLAADLFLNRIGDKRVEEFHCAFLNRANKVIAIERISIGGKSSTVVDVSLICKRAVLTEASGVLMAHNHPSGQLKPSQADIRLTHRLKEALNLLNIQLFDHLIIADRKRFVSLNDKGLI